MVIGATSAFVHSIRQGFVPNFITRSPDPSFTQSQITQSPNYSI